MTETSDKNDYSCVYRTYYDPEKTQLESEVFMMNGKKEGVYKSYHEKGQLFQKVNYINGKREGIYKSYHDNGQLLEEINYIDGKKV